MIALRWGTLFGLFLAVNASAGAFIDLDTSEHNPPYKLYIPTTFSGEAAPLVVAIHGCKQNADSFAEGTRWNQLAEEKGFMVLYPNQGQGRHKHGCWNWFMPENHKPGSGEPLEIIESIERVKSHRYFHEIKRQGSFDGEKADCEWAGPCLERGIREPAFPSLSTIRGVQTPPG